MLSNTIATALRTNAVTNTYMCCMSKLNKNNGFSTQGYYVNYFINALINFSFF